jgi:hypothetical protein
MDIRIYEKLDIDIQPLMIEMKNLHTNDVF